MSKLQHTYQLFYAAQTSDGIHKAEYGNASPALVEDHKAMLAEGTLEYVPDHGPEADHARVRTSAKGISVLLEHLEKYSQACLANGQILTSARHASQAPTFAAQVSTDTVEIEVKIVGGVPEVSISAKDTDANGAPLVNIYVEDDNIYECEPKEEDLRHHDSEISSYG